MSPIDTELLLEQCHQNETRVLPRGNPLHYKSGVEPDATLQTEGCTGQDWKVGETAEQWKSLGAGVFQIQNRRTRLPNTV